MNRIVNSEVVFVSDVSFETTREIPHLFEGDVELHKEKPERPKLMQLLHVKILTFCSNFSVFVSQ